MAIDLCAIYAVVNLLEQQGTPIILAADSRAEVFRLLAAASSHVECHDKRGDSSIIPGAPDLLGAVLDLLVDLLDHLLGRC